jgi:hypothetical protein
VRRIALIIVSVLLLAACGGGGGNADADQVKQVWTSFFSAKTPASQKTAMLQDGARFKAVISTLSADPRAKQLSAKVSSVTLEGAKRAKVVYSIYLGHIAMLSDQTGYAFKVNGKWVVGYAGLCQLVILAGPTPPACNA